MAEIGDTIGLDYFEQLDPEVRQVVLNLRSDLRALGLSIEGRTKRTASRDEMRRRLVAEWPGRYDADVMTDEVFEHLVLLAYVWVVTEEIIAEQQAQRAVEHPDGKWSLDSLRIALAEYKPGIYGRMDNTQVAAMLRKEGIPVVTIRIGGKTHKGIRKADVERLMAGREDRQKGVTRR